MTKIAGKKAKFLKNAGMLKFELETLKKMKRVDKKSES
jgi:hypothetical protein